MLFGNDDAKAPKDSCEAKKRKLNIQKLTLHNLSSVMTMCPSILASICPSPPLTLERESGKLRGHKCAQSVQDTSAHNAMRGLQSKETLYDTLSSSCPC